MEAYFNKRDLKNLIISNDSSKLKGAYGSLYHYEDDYLIKAYIDYFKRESYKTIIKYLDDLRKGSLVTSSIYDDPYSYEENIYKIMNRLSYTKYSYDLIQGVAFYYEYCFGAILRYYKDYVTLDNELVKSLSKKDLIELFHNIEVNLNNMMDNYIYPVDIKEDNIMFDKNLNVKLIDLDDPCTYYCDGYQEDKKNMCNYSFKEVKEKILK